MSTAMTDDSISTADIELIYRSIHRTSGDGSNGREEGYIDENGIQQNDGRSKTQTGFDSSRPVDAHGEQVNNPTVNRNGRTYRKWEWLNQLNDGVQSSERGVENWKAGKINDAKLFCEHLEFNAEKTQKVVEMAEQLDFDKFGSYNTGQVLVGCCSLVSDEDTTNFDDRIVIRDEFKELMDVTHLGSREHRKIRQGIRERTDFF